MAPRNVSKAPPVTVAVSAEQAVAFRAASHGLTAGSPRPAVSPAALAAAARAALPDYPRGATLRALAARCSGVRADTLAHALAGGTLVRALSLRGTAHVFAADDLAVFTVGALPTPGDEAATQAALGSAWPTFSTLGVAAVDALATVASTLGEVAADGKARTKGELSEALHDRLADGWEPWCERCGAHHVPDQLFRLAAVAAGLRYADDGPTMVAGASPPASADPAEHAAARAELVRRFLHAYGPAPAKAFAEWTGLGAKEATASFAALGDEVVEVRLDGTRTAVLATDVPALTSPPTEPVRRTHLLAAGDPFLQQRDRATLVPDPARRKELWRPAGAPGLVLVDGRPAGTWRHKEDKGTTVVTVDLWDPPAGDLSPALHDEAVTTLTIDDPDLVEVVLA